MQGPSADRYRADFDAWHSNPANAKAYAALRHDFEATSHLPADLVASLAHGHDAVRHKRRQQWAVAAALILSLSAGVAWIAIGSDSAKPVVAATDSVREQRLSDGTLVALLEGAAIEARFTSSERTVRMAGGRARFTVAHDASRPFRVIAGPSVTTALGTVFEVDMRGPVPRIHLIRGSVELAGGPAERPALRLVPGESAEVDADGPRRVPTMVNPAEADKLDADRLPLGAIIERANRVNARKIGLADPALAALRVSGRFEISDGDALARKLAAALDLRLDTGPQGPILKQP
ncbi:FecR family protein [Sphingopyxis terrae]|nr:FecR domain-containing protein [Sphingopyxis terrae]